MTDVQNTTTDSNVQNTTTDSNVQNTTTDSNVQNSTTDSNVQNSTTDLNVQNSTTDSNVQNTTTDSNVQNSTTDSNEPTIKLYWLSESRADRIVLLLEELEVPYVIEKIERGPDRLAPPELKKIHPLGKSPVIKDGDKVIAESGFIIDYLIEKYGKDKNLKPTNSEDLFHYNYFLHYIEGSLMSILVMKYVFLTIQKQAPWIVKPIVNGICNKLDALYLRPNMKTHMDFLESELGQRKWLAGEQFSGADIQAGFALEMLMKLSNVNEEGATNISRYLKEMHERPAYKRAMEKIGKNNQ
ncbi:unnamed protein product [Rotaria sordida]|uniref:Glutathione S-transferase n=1 Tax=Rotaria sordida TaxID=392033 RepID=A0A818YBZ7_9BILA|nr:unnamed protein product [Rotaria sordida]